VSAPAAILFSLFPLLIVVWIASSVIFHLKRNAAAGERSAEAHERIATALEDANTLTRIRTPKAEEPA
jgi:hypothetical protein